MEIVVKGAVNVLHSLTGSNGEFEYDVTELGFSYDEWLKLTEEQRRLVIDDLLDSEIASTLDCYVTWEYK